MSERGSQPQDVKFDDAHYGAGRQRHQASFCREAPGSSKSYRIRC